MAILKCVICNKSPAKACAACKSAAYCGQTCQKIDWSVHKTLCSSFAKLSPRPATPSKLGILLPADSPNPQFVWVPCPKLAKQTLHDGDEAISFDNPTILPLLGPQTDVERFHVRDNQVRGYQLDRTLVLHFRDNSLNDGSKPNQAALALTGWNLPHSWRGNIVILSYAPAAKDEEGFNPYLEYDDVTVADMRATIDCLSRYGEGNTYGPQDCNGVLIRCEGEISLNRKSTGKWERYSDVKVKRGDTIWEEQPIAASKIMGLPLLIRKCPPNPAWDQNQYNIFQNQPATFLNIAVRPNEYSWGLAPPEWQNNVGNVLLVRQDGENLSREQGWAIAEYMQFRVSDVFEDVSEAEDTKGRRGAVLKMLNWKSFDNFLEGFKQKMTAADYKTWANVRSPFGTKK